MDFLRRFRYLVYGLVLLSLVGFTYAQQSYPLMLASCVGVALSWWLVETPGSKPIPRLLINFGVITASVILFVELVVMQEQNLLIGLGHFMIALVICKLFEQKSNRDYGQILILSLLIMMSATILTASLFFGLLLVVYVGIGLYTSLVFHLRCETQRAVASHAATDSTMIAAGSAPAIARDIRRVMGVSVWGLLLISLVIFLAIPRGLVPAMLLRWRLPGRHGPTITGFSDHVSFGDIGRLQESNARVMTVHITKNGKNIGSAGYQPYFAGETLNVYDARTRQWLRSASAGHILHRLSFYSGVARILPATLYDQHKLVMATYRQSAAASEGRPVIFSIAPPVAVLAHDIHHLEQHADLTLRCRAPHRWPLKYSIITSQAYSRYAYGVRRPALFPIYMSFDMLGPPEAMAVRSSSILPRIRGLAKKVAGKLLALPRNTLAQRISRDVALARRFRDYLRSRYPYTLNLTPVDPSIDPTEDFLFNRRKIGGDCEFFASAMVMFCRAVKLPARMATGYLGGDYNAKTGAYVVRQRFAHAWAQVWIPSRGWVRFDPSPSNSIPPAPHESALWRWVHGVAEYVKRNWLAKVINFDNTNRKTLLKKVSGGFGGLAGAVKHFVVDAAHELAAIIGMRRGFVLWALWLILTVGGIASLAALIKKWRRQKTSAVARMFGDLKVGARRQWMRDLAFFDELMRTLSRAGVQRSAGQTPREYVDAAAGRLGSAAADAQWLIGVFYELRYGAVSLTPTLRDSIQAHLVAFRQHLRAIPARAAIAEADPHDRYNTSHDR